ncbi:MAG: ABC transporter substrate-binding protein [Treponema sp.]|jgi:multiple sugar transport system substrate-binding protein|nr:ABC transporter substrate-binding protein [Treponema sp.]
MKRIFFTQCALAACALAALVFLAGCRGKEKAENGLNSDFFSRKIEGEITVSAYDSQAYKNFLEEAAKAFEALYPGTKVKVETFSAMPEVRSGGQGNMQVTLTEIQNDPQGRADYISRINTNLMSGTGADVYAMDVLPLHKFAVNGTLENLDSYMAMDPKFHKGDYRENVLDAVRYQNGTWFLPLNYRFNYFSYDTTLVPAGIASQFGIDKSFSTEELLKIGMGLYTGAYKIFNTNDYSRDSRNMFAVLLSENIQSYLNLETKKPNFVDGSFAAMLNSVKNYSQQGLIPQGVTGQQNAGPGRQRAIGIGEPTDRFYFKQNNTVNLLSQFTRSLGIINRTMTGGTAMSIDADDEIAGIQANADGSVPFTYSRGFGINSQSKNKETAWAFLMFLLSREIQNSADMMNTVFPVNNKAREETAELAFTGMFRNSNGVLNDQQRQALTQYKRAVETLSDSINCFVVQDTSLNDMIASEAQYFFSGSRTADEVAKVLQNKADLYLNE